MLSNESRPYIEASVPVLRENGVTITRAFYHNMFKEYPELTHLFNMGNQANGTQQQSLASAVFAYASNFDNPDALAPVISRIVHKHVSVGIKPEHYPIVGRHLLGAIQETLGEAATPPLLAAWGEAYGLLSSALINAEKQLYSNLHTTAGELITLNVLDKHRESENVISFRLGPLEGNVLPTFKPGQYLSVTVKFPDGRQQIRQYSLSDAPGKKWLRISIKREPAGLETPAGQVSNWLHDTLNPGDQVQVSAPCGDFTPDTQGNDPIVLLSAGIGITPMISVLNEIATINPYRTVIFGHAARNAAHHAHQDDLAVAQALMPNFTAVIFYEQPDKATSAFNVHTGRMDIAALPEWPRATTSVYLCGPLKFMQEQWNAALTAGVPVARLHREVFGPEMLDHLL